MKLCQGTFRFKISSRFLPQRVAERWNPGKWSHHQACQSSRSDWTMLSSTMCYSWGCSVQGWPQWSLWVSSRCFMVLWSISKGYSPLETECASWISHGLTSPIRISAPAWAPLSICSQVLQEACSVTLRVNKCFLLFRRILLHLRLCSSTGNKKEKIMSLFSFHTPLNYLLTLMIFPLSLYFYRLNSHCSLSIFLEEKSPCYLLLYINKVINSKEGSLMTRNCIIRKWLFNEICINIIKWKFCPRRTCQLSFIKKGEPKIWW